MNHVKPWETFVPVPIRSLCLADGFTFSNLFPKAPIDSSLSYAQEGILGHVAYLMVNEVVKIILGLEGVLSGKVLTTDLKSGQQRTYRLNKPPSAI